MSDNIQESFEGTRAAGIIAAGALDEVARIIKPGISTNDIDNLCYEFINDNNAYSAPLFYRGFPKSCCTSANHVICHGIPQNKVLSEGDIINVDVTAYKNNWHGDTSRMFHVGEVSVKAKKLTDVKKQYTLYENWVRDEIKKRKLKPITPKLKKGQCILWAANLLHGSPDCQDSTLSRKSQVTHWTFDCVKMHYNPNFSIPSEKKYIKREVNYF